MNRAADLRIDNHEEIRPTPESRSTIFFGGPILTLVDKLPEVEAIAIKDGRISALGSRANVLQTRTAETSMIDLGGRVLLPGFVEPHVHIAWSALTNYHCIDVSPLETPTRAQVLARLGSAANSKTRGEWVFAFGYDPTNGEADEQLLTAADLDNASMTNPIFLMTRSSEIAYVNQRALEIVGAQKPAPDGSSVTGKLCGVESFAPFLAALPPIRYEQKLKDCRRVLWGWARKGCTTVYDAGVGSLWGQEEVRLLLELASDPATPVRIRAALVPSGDLPRAAGIRPGQGNDRLSFVGIGVSAADLKQDDGAHAQSLLTQIDNQELNSDDGRLRDQLKGWHDAGWQLLVHASGNKALDRALRVFEAVLTASPRAHRHRIEGCESIDERQFARAQQLGLSISYSVSPVCHDGKLRLAGSWNHDLNGGLAVSLHSDAPAAPVEPLRYLRTAMGLVKRDTSEGFGDNQPAAVDRALKTITIQAARQCFLDEKIGSLAPGKIADFVVLSSDPRQTDPDRFAEIEVIETYVDGALRSH